MKLQDIVPNSTARQVTDAIQSLTTPTVRLGVTGLSRAGKTVFITALIRNLMGPRRMPFFHAAHANVLKNAVLKPQPDDDVPSFAYGDHIDTLRGDPPRWPESTRHISQVRIALQLEPQTAWGSLTGTRQLYLDIVDYPGEWLLDLGLMDIDYATWSSRVLERVFKADHEEIAAEFKEFLAPLQTATTFDDRLATKAARAFAAYLKIAREKPPGLATLGPGRFLLPGELEGSPLLTFAPLPPTDGGDEPAMYKEFARRFEAYKSRVVRPFFNDHFKKLDRQIVLVDALAALNGGAQSLEDLRAALRGALRAFRPGTSSWLGRLIGDVRIDKILFVATKADHLPQASHDRLQRVLRLLTDEASGEMETSGADVSVLALAAIRATRERTATEGGVEYSVITGTPIAGEEIAGERYDGKTQAGVFPGDLPEDPARALADAEQGALANLKFVRFAPPSLDAGAIEHPWPHIRLDRALEYLLADRLP